LHSKYYSKEQLEELEEQEKKIGVSGVKDAINEWPTLIQKVRSQMESGVNPSDIKLKPLVQRWIDLKNMFSGGNPQIEESTRKMYEENPDMAKRYQLDPSIFEYVQKAVDAHKIV
ncbi:MAG: TipAS antibiotic-recognition domain-containing protein, partial [Crocinitomicaceae bacterium]|nr:TipAS antibiotic-recognition domain-containing protein [Crocinitomicaceae bacterium]